MEALSELLKYTVPSLVVLATAYYLLKMFLEKEAEKNQTDKVVRKEFSNKAFKRSFTLDEKIEGGSIEAKYENGILKLTLPKKEVANVVTKEITIQ